MPTCERACHTAGDPPLPWKEARGKERPCCPPHPCGEGVQGLVRCVQEDCLAWCFPHGHA